MASHSEHVLQQLCSQLEYGFLCDCSIAVGDVRFRAHRVVLAACSSYFHKLFVNSPSDSSLVSLSSQAVSPDHFDLILQLMYTGRLSSAPSDPERFRASLRFLKLYNAACFLASGPGEQEREEGPTPACANPLVFGVQLYQDRAVGPTDGLAAGEVSVEVKAEATEEASDRQAYLCHHCGLAFEEQCGLKEHLQLHAERPLHCPLCDLAFETAQRLQEHVACCLSRGQGVKREEAERAGAQAMACEESRPGHCVESREGYPGFGGAGGEVPWAKRSWHPEREPEDYELEEGEVRFPGDDDLVLENGTDDSLSSSDSSLDGEGEAKSEPSEEEGGSGTASAPATAQPPAQGPGGGWATCQGARRKGKAWRCRACEGCCLSEVRSWSRKRRRKETGGEASVFSQERPGGGGLEPRPSRDLGRQLASQAHIRAFPRELRLQLASQGGRGRLECPFCGQRSHRKRGHLRHMTSHLSPGQAVCHMCFEIVGSKADLQRHLESHMYSCGVCGEKFRLKKDMVAHANSCWTRKLHGTDTSKLGLKGKD